jgi:hydrogenase maturation protease
MWCVRDLVVGVGNIDRGDDGVGRVVARSVRERAPGVHVVELDGEAASLIDAMHEADRVWLIDAACSNAPPGTIHRIDCADGVPLPAGPVSSHGFGVAEAIALARALGTLPAQCIVYAIEGTRFGVGDGASAAVLKAADAVVQRILAETTPPRLSSRGHSLRRAPAIDRQ